MTSNAPAQPSPRLQEILRQLDAQGSVSLRGRRSDVVMRWLRRRNTMLGIVFGIGGIGLLLMIAGLLLGDLGAWGALIPLGLLLLFGGVGAGGALGLQTRLMGGWLRAERQPVVIDAGGIVLRGIGPIPWSDVEPPERRHIPVKNDIGGRCTVMPLTAQGHARVNGQTGWWTHLVGPKPYLRFDVPCLLLPGVDGLTEDETVRLFQAAHERYAR